MERLTHRYTDGQAFVPMTMLKPMMENEIVGLPIKCYKCDRKD